MDKHWPYLVLLLLPAAAFGFVEFDIHSKCDKELAMLRDMLASPIPQFTVAKSEPIIGEYFLITPSGIKAVTAAPAARDVEVITLECGATIYFCKLEDTQ